MHHLGPLYLRVLPSNAEGIHQPHRLSIRLRPISAARFSVLGPKRFYLLSWEPK